MPKTSTSKKVPVSSGTFRFYIEFDIMTLKITSQLLKQCIDTAKNIGLYQQLVVGFGKLL